MTVAVANYMKLDERVRSTSGTERTSSKCAPASGVPPSLRTPGSRSMQVEAVWFVQALGAKVDVAVQAIAHDSVYPSNIFATLWASVSHFFVLLMGLQGSMLHDSTVDKAKLSAGGNT